MFVFILDHCSCQTNVGIQINDGAEITTLNHWSQNAETSFS